MFNTIDSSQLIGRLINMQNKGIAKKVHMFYLSIHYLESYIGFAGVFNPDGTLNLLARFIYT